MPDLSVNLRQIESGDKLTGLKLGEAQFTPLKTFFQKHAKTFHAKNLGKTYALFLNTNGASSVIGYITLVCGEVVTENEEALIQDPGLGYPYNSYPAIKIARLAIDKRYSGQGLGRELVQFALGLTKDMICPNVGCRFVMVDAKQPSVKFYQACGFKLLDTEANKARSEPIMFLDMTKV